MNETLPTKQQMPNPRRRALRTFLLVVGLFLLYAFAVQATEINLEKPLDPNRQEGVVRVLRLLADPDIFQVDQGQIVGLSEAARITFSRIIETILMALMASTIGTVLAVPISFIAARNLMAPVTAPLAAIMAALIALPIGGWIGSLVGQLLIGAAEQVTAQPLIGLGVLVGLLLAAWLTVWLGPPIVTPKRRPRRETAVAVARIIAALVMVLVALGILAILGHDAGNWLEDQLGWFGFLGGFLTVISDVIRLGLPALIGLLAALIAVSYGSRYGQEAVLSLPITPARVITAVLTALGTAILIYGIGSFLNWLYLFDQPENWTLYPALVGAAIGFVVGLVVAPKRPFPIGTVIYTISRSVLNVLRSIEPLIMGIVFVVWVSLGPFAGVMALTLHSIAALGKLFSEQVEGIDDGPIEAITSTGASRLQMIVFGVIPQIVPPFIAFTLYRWDINVRMSTIIGFVGGGGIGFVLSQNIQQLRYRQASVMMLAIAAVVATLDYVSSRIRARII